MRPTQKCLHSVKKFAPYARKITYHKKKWQINWASALLLCKKSNKIVRPRNCVAMCCCEYTLNSA